MTTAPRVDEIEARVQGLATLSTGVSLTYVAAPFTAVVNRAQMVDLSNDLCTRIGIERVQFNELVRLPDERGPTGQTIYKDINDKFDRVRFYGDWLARRDSNGVYVDQASGGTNTNTSVEISFYGTGLNLLCTTCNGSKDARITLDGNAEVGATFMPTTISSTLEFRNQNENLVINVVSGETLGLHTVKVRYVDWLGLSGYEVLNESSNVTVSAGTMLHKGKSRTSTQTTLAYGSGFAAEEGTDTGDGGTVIVYQQEDGVIAHSIKWNDAGQLNLNSVTHAEEEVTSRYNWREFGCGRADGFDIYMTSRAGAHTLNDGTTTLFGEGTQNAVGGTATGDAITWDSGNTDGTFTFVGTGVDAVLANDGSARNTDMYVDNVNLGNVADTEKITRIQTIASGLPYGTHTFQMNKSSGSGQRFREFMVYNTKKPTLPAEAVELATYNLMATFNYAAAVSNFNSISDGTLRKVCTKEFVYRGGAYFGPEIAVTARTAGWRVRNNATTNVCSYTFWGTGFDMRFDSSNAGAHTTFDIDGESDFDAGSFGALTVNTSLSAGSFVSSTGVMTGNSGASSSISITGLPLGLHTLSMTTTIADSWQTESIDIVTPVYSPARQSGHSAHDTQRVGSCSVADSRVFLESQIPKVYSSVNCDGIDVSPVVDQRAPMHQMSSSIYVEEAGKYRAACYTPFYAAANHRMLMYVYINGILKRGGHYFKEGNLTSTANGAYYSEDIHLAQGDNHVSIFMERGDGSSPTLDGENRHFTIVKV